MEYKSTTRIYGEVVNSAAEGETIFRPHDIEWTDEKVRRLWKYYGGNPAYRNAYFARHSGHRVIKEAARYTPLRGVIVDLGCGPGYMLEHLVKQSGWREYVGIDSSKDSLVELRQKVDPAGRRIQVVHANESASVLSPNVADLVLCVEVIEHCDDEAVRSVLGCASRLLKPDGCLFLTTPNAENLNSSMLLCPECGCRFHHWQHIRSWAPDTLYETLVACGLDVIRIYTCDFSSKSMGFGWRHCLRQLMRGRWGGRYSHMNKPHLVAVARRTTTI